MLCLAYIIMFSISFVLMQANHILVNITSSNIPLKIKIDKEYTIIDYAKGHPQSRHLAIGDRIIKLNKYVPDSMSLAKFESVLALAKAPYSILISRKDITSPTNIDNAISGNSLARDQGRLSKIDVSVPSSHVHIHVKNGIRTINTFKSQLGEYVYNIECHKSYRIIPYYPLDGCTPLKLPTQTTKGSRTKKISTESYYNSYVIMERGKCTFEDKIRMAMITGAIGVILINSENNTFAIPMPKDSNIKIPSMVVSSSDGAKILGVLNEAGVKDDLTIKITDINNINCDMINSNNRRMYELDIVDTGSSSLSLESLKNSNKQHRNADSSTTATTSDTFVSQQIPPPTINSMQAFFQSGSSISLADEFSIEPCGDGVMSMSYSTLVTSKLHKYKDIVTSKDITVTMPYIKYICEVSGSSSESTISSTTIAKIVRVDINDLIADMFSQLSIIAASSSVSVWSTNNNNADINNRSIMDDNSSSSNNEDSRTNIVLYEIFDNIQYNDESNHTLIIVVTNDSQYDTNISFVDTPSRHPLHYTNQHIVMAIYKYLMSEYISSINVVNMVILSDMYLGDYYSILESLLEHSFYSNQYNTVLYSIDYIESKKLIQNQYIINNNQYDNKITLQFQTVNQYMIVNMWNAVVNYCNYFYLLPDIRYKNKLYRKVVSNDHHLLLLTGESNTSHSNTTSRSTTISNVDSGAVYYLQACLSSRATDTNSIRNKDASNRVNNFVLKSVVRKGDSNHGVIHTNNYKHDEL